MPRNPAEVIKLGEDLPGNPAEVKKLGEDLPRNPAEVKKMGEDLQRNPAEGQPWDPMVIVIAWEYPEVGMTGSGNWEYPEVGIPGSGNTRKLEYPKVESPVTVVAADTDLTRT